LKFLGKETFLQTSLQDGLKNSIEYFKENI